VGKWQDNAAVVGDITHTEMKGNGKLMTTRSIPGLFHYSTHCGTDVFSTFL